jgi:hypothetical protein
MPLTRAGCPGQWIASASYPVTGQSHGITRFTGSCHGAGRGKITPGRGTPGPTRTHHGIVTQFVFQKTGAACQCAAAAALKPGLSSSSTD